MKRIRLVAVALVMLTGSLRAQTDPLATFKWSERQQLWRNLNSQ